MKINIRIPEYKNREDVLSSFVSFVSENGCESDLNSSEYTLLPGFCDVHVHFRQPGFSYKETIKTGSLAAARGGYTSVCTMPNLNPVPDCAENLKLQTEIIKHDAVIAVYPYGAVTKAEAGKELSDMQSLSPNVVAFSDDGRGVQSEVLMRLAMEKARDEGKIIAAHCEVNSLLNGGVIHAGKYAEQNHFPGISSESEYRMIDRDLNLCAETGCKYHVCHISCKESAELIRQAKKSGIDVTCETAPHYLVLCDENLQDDGRFKMNPPLRSAKDREALIEAILDGTVDMIATDHAPHSAEEKSRGLMKSAFGIVGLETAFPLLYTYLVKKNIVSLKKLVSLMSDAPRNRFNIPLNGFCIWNLNEEFTVDSNEFLSAGRATPFEGKRLSGVNIITVYNSKAVYKKI